MLEARRAWTSECEAYEHFRGGLLVALEDGEWLDISIWERPRPLDGRGPDEPPIVDFMDRVDGPGMEILGQESGVVALQTAGRITASVLDGHSGRR